MPKGVTMGSTNKYNIEDSIPKSNRVLVPRPESPESDKSHDKTQSDRQSVIKSNLTMIVQNQNNENNPDWLNCERILLDSGCSHHMARESSCVLDFVENCERKLGYG